MRYRWFLGLLAIGCQSVVREPVAPTRTASPSEPVARQKSAPRADLPDLSGSWEGRGLLPFTRPALWALEKTERTQVSPGVWRFSSTLSLHTRDRVRKVGEATMEGTTTFQGEQACSRLSQVRLTVEAWTGEIPLGAQVKDALRKGGKHRSGCGAFEATAAELSIHRDDLVWTEKRP